jgi:hypothetical protein
MIGMGTQLLILSFAAPKIEVSQLSTFLGGSTSAACIAHL